MNSVTETRRPGGIRECPAGLPVKAYAPVICQVSNIRLRPSPQEDIGAATVKRTLPLRMGAKMDKQCRKCGSDDLVKASLVHEAGTSGVESVTVGAGMGGGGLRLLIHGRHEREGACWRLLN